MPAKRHTPAFGRRTFAFAVALALVALSASAAHACPTCGAGYSEAGEAGQKMLNGWFWSIIFMMSMPFAIVASLGGYMYWIVRKARRTRETEPAAQAPTASP
ncbi:MAG: hypothetical protein DCC67_13315 [Planctomycetota bacterium]|nr:MAG: hypothetical protein DCC67_13315 [Planctomycetota bacterium]